MTHETPLNRVAFWYLRHGETDWNARNLSQGNVDIPLNEAGLEQAQLAAGLLKNRGIRTIVSSPLSRARVTAETVAAALGIPVQFDPDLREAAFGVQEGQKMGEWYDGWVHKGITPDGAEPFAALRRRAVGAVNRATGLPPVVLVVAHGALFRALRFAMGLEPNVRTRNGVPFWCAPPAGGQSAWDLQPPAQGMALTIP